MTPEFKAIKILCPQCRASLAGLGLRPGMRRLCPYCGTSFVSGAGNMQEAAVEMPDRVIPFTTDRKDFEREVLKCLARNDRTPSAIFDSISFLDAEGVYFPAYLYEGEYRLPQEQDGDAQAPQPRRGIFGFRGAGRETADPGHTFSILCAAGDSPEMLREMSVRMASRKEECSRAKLYSSQLLDMAMFIPAAAGSEEVWSVCGEDALRKEVSASHRHGAPAADRDIALSGRVKSKLILMPFWLATFRHCGHTYRFIMDGTDASSIMEFLPPVLSEEEPGKRLRAVSDYLLVTAWLSLILLFWNIWWPPALIWAAWLIVFIIIRIRKAASGRRSKKSGI